MMPFKRTYIAWPMAWLPVSCLHVCDALAILLPACVVVVLLPNEVLPQQCYNVLLHVHMQRLCQEGLMCTRGITLVCSTGEAA